MTEGSDPSAQPGDQPPPGNQPPAGDQPPPGNQPPPGYQPPPGNQPPPGYPPQQPPGYPPPPGNPQQGYPPAPPAAAGHQYPAAPAAPQAAQYGPGGTVFDPASGLYLPPGTQLASHGRRIGAWFLAILLFIVTLGIGYIIWGLIAWSKGTTPALQVLGMKCYMPDSGRVPGFWRMVLRDFVGRIVEGIVGIITQLVSFILFLTSAKRQALHDLIGSTVVLHDPNKVLG